MTPILELNLHGHYFDMIESGMKPEEYRDIKPFFNRIFRAGQIKVRGTWYPAENVLIRFSNGYQRDRRQMIVQCTGIRSGYGHTQLGAPQNKPVYILQLHC